MCDDTEVSYMVHQFIRVLLSCKDTIFLSEKELFLLFFVSLHQK